MFVINNATDKLVLRPLVTFDKMDIMDMARKIGTYETSILPYPDSCTVFMPDNPIITANLDKVLKEESKLDIEEIIQATLNNTETFFLKYFFFSPALF
jgi:thiamine biosynthesis protein ThiI